MTARENAAEILAIWFFLSTSCYFAGSLLLTKINGRKKNKILSHRRRH